MSEKTRQRSYFSKLLFKYIYVYVYMILWYIYTYILIHTHTYIYEIVVFQSLSHVWLFVTLWTVARQAPLSMGFFQAILLEWVVISFSRGSCQFGGQTCVSFIGRRILCHWATWEAQIRDYIYLKQNVTYGREREKDRWNKMKN